MGELEDASHLQVQEVLLCLATETNWLQPAHPWHTQQNGAMHYGQAGVAPVAAFFPGLLSCMRCVLPGNWRVHHTLSRLGTPPRSLG